MMEGQDKSVEGTTIDPRSLLSTDYFNHFNEVIMMLGMLPDAPELLGEIDLWEFRDYRQHFAASGLLFAPLAIELYGRVTPDIRRTFEKLIDQIKLLILESRASLRHVLEDGRKQHFDEMAKLASLQLQSMVDAGGAVVHGRNGSLDQDTIDGMF